MLCKDILIKRANCQQTFSTLLRICLIKHDWKGCRITNIKSYSFMTAYDCLISDWFVTAPDSCFKLLDDWHWFLLGFPTGRDSATFRDKGTEVSSLSRDKGTTGQAKNFAKGQDWPGQPKFGMGRTGTAKIRDGTRDKTGQSRKGCSKTVVLVPKNWCKRSPLLRLLISRKTRLKTGNHRKKMSRILKNSDCVHPIPDFDRLSRLDSSHGKILSLYRCPSVPGQWRNFCPFFLKSCTVLSCWKP